MVFELKNFSLYLILCAFTVLMMLSSCASDNQSVSTETEFLPGNTADTSTSKEEIEATREYRFSLKYEAMKPYLDETHSPDALLTTSYPLTELMDYFFYAEPQKDAFDYLDIPISSELRFEDGSAYNSEYAKLEEINARFPLECTRLSEGEGIRREFYTVYQITEGGRFYLFWIMTDTQSMVAYSGIYIPKMLPYEAFDSIIPGKSTFGDVVSLDPSTELDFFSGGGLRSATRLQDGTYLTLYYDIEQQVETIKDYIILERSRSVEPCGWLLCMIREEDLP